MIHDRPAKARDAQTTSKSLNTDRNALRALENFKNRHKTSFENGLRENGSGSPHFLPSCPMACPGM